MTKYTPEKRKIIFWSQVLMTADDEQCWEWQGNKTGQYGSLSVDYEFVYAHRFAWELVNGVIPEGLNVLHSCDNPPCCNPKHLFLGTHQDNMNDMMAKGRKRVAVGEHNGSHKLTSSQVRTIREMYKNGTSINQLAIQFNVTRQNINCILKFKTWKHEV